jgi:light-regulated signal transduction histidine kinase (bacteriophytochrome)
MSAAAHVGAAAGDRRVSSRTEKEMARPQQVDLLNGADEPVHIPRNRSGMGLGLYIAHRIVREHHGEIGYHHADGQVVFTLRLPPADSAA